MMTKRVERNEPGRSAPDGRFAAAGNLPETIAALQPGDHLCCLYRTEEEHQAVLGPYLRLGLEQGQKVLYIADAHAAETITGYLTADGIDVAAYLRRGQLQILEPRDAYLKDGYFDPDRMIALLASETDKAMGEGYRGLRVTGEMTWALKGHAGSDKLIEYEAKLNHFFPGSRCLAICQYDMRAFDAAVLLDVLRTHPAAIVGTEIYDNFYYVPPDDLLEGQTADKELSRWIGHLDERKQAEEALRESEHRFETLAEESFDSIVIHDKGEIIEANKVFASTWGYEPHEIVGMHARDLIAPESYGEVMERIAAEDESPYEARGLKKDGTRFSIEVARKSIMYRGKDVRISTARDITERKRAEEALRAEKAYSESIVDTAPTIVLVLDTEGRIVRFNPYMEEISGYAMEEVVGKDWFTTFLPPRDQDHIRRVFQRSIADIQTSGNINPIVTRDGRERLIEWYDKTLKDPEGRVTGVVAIGQDITERKRSEEALRESEARFRRLAENAQDLIYRYEFTPQAGFTYVSPAATPMTGYTPEEHYADPELGFKIVHPEDRPLLEGVLQGEQGFGQPIFLRWARKDGTTIWTEQANVPVYDEAGNLVAVEGIARDITERKRAEEELAETTIALRERIKELRCLYKLSRLTEPPIGSLDEVMRAGVALLPPAWQFPEAACARIVLDGMEFASDGFEVTQWGLLSPIVVRGLERGSVEVFYKHKTSGADTDPFLPEERDLINAVAAHLSRTIDRKEAETELSTYRRHLEELVAERTSELREAQEQLVRQERLATLGQVAGSISHEIRNPLGVISNSVYFLKQKLGNEDEKVREYLDRIQGSVQNCTNIVQSLLDLTRMKDPEPAPVDIREVVSIVLTEEGVPPKVRVIRELAEAPVIINADRHQLAMAFRNIVDNAVAAMDGHGELAVSVRGKDNAWAEVTFRDTGSGISEEHLDRIFEPLFSTRARGIGFGLSIVKLVIEKHGGEIEVESKTGHGTQVTVRLPLQAKA